MRAAMENSLSSPSQNSTSKSHHAILTSLTDTLQTICNATRAVLCARSPFHSLKVPPISIRDYIFRVFKYSKCSEECLALALIYVIRFCEIEAVDLTFYNIHRLLITGVLVAAKFRDDLYFSNTYYAHIGGVPVAELNSLEVAFLKALDWNLWVPPEEYDFVVEKMKSGSFAEDWILELRASFPAFANPSLLAAFHSGSWPHYHSVACEDLPSDEPQRSHSLGSFHHVHVHTDQTHLSVVSRMMSRQQNAARALQKPSIDSIADGVSGTPSAATTSDDSDDE